MTREKAIKEYVTPALKHTWNEKINKEVLEALEQETVSKESYDHEYFLRKEFEIKITKLESVLDKIRAEIKQLPTYDIFTYENYLASEFKHDVLDVIDKYKAESEK